MTMLRPVRGVLLVEGIQTGDGRLVVEGATTWVDPPLPLAWLVEGDQHVDLVEVAPTIGTLDTITRTGNEIEWTGAIDDEDEFGAEAVRRMEAGSAPLGPRFGLSVDPDDWEVEIIITDADDSADDEALIAAPSLVASGTGAPPSFRRVLTAAAGDPDPGAGGGDDGVTLFEAAADEILERYTRFRLRGATLCAVGAFAEAYCELDGVATDEADDEAEPVDENAGGEAVAAAVGCGCGGTAGRMIATTTTNGTACSCNVQQLVAAAPALVRGLVGPDRPAGELFAPLTTEPDGSLNIDGEEVSGYVCMWDTCHTGILDRCVTPPREADYDLFMHGAVVTERGDRQPVGVFTWGIPHADLTLAMIAAQAHYADSRHGFAHVAVGANEHGIWHHGALRPGTTRADVRDLRALSMSGDWRQLQRTGGLRMIAALAVNYPGFPVPRRQAALAASTGRPLEVGPLAHIVDGEVLSLVAAGMVAPRAAAQLDPDLAVLLERERSRSRQRLIDLRTAAARRRLART